MKNEIIKYIVFIIIGLVAATAFRECQVRDLRRTSKQFEITAKTAEKRIELIETKFNNCQSYIKKLEQNDTKLRSNNKQLKQSIEELRTNNKIIKEFKSQIVGSIDRSIEGIEKLENGYSSIERIVYGIQEKDQ